MGNQSFWVPGEVWLQSWNLKELTEGHHQINVQYLCSMFNGQYLCPMDICLSIGSNGQWQCPMDIWMSNGHFDRAILGSIQWRLRHSPAERVHWVHWIQWSMAMSNGHLNVKLPFWPRYPGFYSLETMTQPSKTCSLGSLDPMFNGNVQWTFECQMAMLTALSWVLLSGDYDTAQQSVFIGLIGFIGSNGQWQCPMDIWMSNGHVDRAILGSYSLETITQPRRTCSLGSLDPMVNGNVQWTFECQMAMLTALSWVLLSGDYDTAQQSVFIGFIGFIGSNGQWQCPMDIWMSNGHVGCACRFRTMCNGLLSTYKLTMIQD